MKLYRVTFEITAMIEAKSEADAERFMDAHLREMDGEIEQAWVTARAVNHERPGLSEQELNSFPWGGNGCHTVRSLLASRAPSPERQKKETGR